MPMVLPSFMLPKDSCSKDEAQLQNVTQDANSIAHCESPGSQSNSSNHRKFSTVSLDSADLEYFISSMQTSTSHFKSVISSQTRIRDESEVFTGVLICITVVVASSCGLAAWVLHMAVRYAGCMGGVNGCHDHVLVDIVDPLGIGTSLFFIISCGLSGLCCSLILHTPCHNGIARRCKGGGAADTKIVISSGQTVSGWVVILRILLACIYCGGGNPLGTEGPIIHLSSSLATWLVSLTGRKRKKFLSTFGVIGATAGISAGFNVLVTGFVYVIEELTRTLSRKLALILAFAAGVAVLVKDLLEKFLDNFWHQGHAHLMPEHETWDKLTDADIHLCLLLCIPIGALTGVAGWIFCHCAWTLSKFLERLAHWRFMGCRCFPSRSHLAIIGVLCGCLGAVGYEATGINVVWGTTIDAIPTALHKHLSWQHALLLFSMKFIAFILATAGGGPGGLLVPSLITGGLLGVTVARVTDGSENLCAACAVIGMGAMFASVMHLPVTGVIIIFELTRADKLILHIVLASFISSNVVARLPHGSHSFVHRQLLHNPLWLKLEQRDFIETDEHEIEADVAMFKSTFAVWLWTDNERLRHYFDMWQTGVKGKLLRAPTVNFFEEYVSEALGGDLSPKSTTSHRSWKSKPSQPNSPKSVVGHKSGAGRAHSGQSASPRNSFGSEWSNGDLHDAPRRKERKISINSHSSNASSFASPRTPHELDSAEAYRRRENYDKWTKVAKVIPGLNWRIWKTLDNEQINAIAHAAEITATASTVAREFVRDAPSRETSRDMYGARDFPSRETSRDVFGARELPSRETSRDVFGASERGVITPPATSNDGGGSPKPSRVLQNGVQFTSGDGSPAKQNGMDAQCVEYANGASHLVLHIATQKTDSSIANSEAAYVPVSVNYQPSYAVGLRQL